MQKERLYIHFYNGRDQKNKDTDDWGYDGPVIGPFSSIQATYRDHIKCHAINLPCFVDFFWNDNDMIDIDGVEHGDFEIITSDKDGDLGVDPISPQDFYNAQNPTREKQ